MKLIMENWRNFLSEEQKKPATWKDISAKLKNKYDDIDVFYLQNNFIQRYSSKTYSLLAKRRGEDIVSKSKTNPRSLTVKPKGKSFSPELRWSYEHEPAFGGEGANYSQEAPENMADETERNQGRIAIYHHEHPHHLMTNRLKGEEFNELVLMLSDFIKSPENISRFPNCNDGGCFDPAVVDDFVRFTLLIPALSKFSTLQHELIHHNQAQFPDNSWDLETYKKVFKNAKDEFGIDPEEILDQIQVKGRITNCYSSEIAVALENKRLLVRALPKIISDFQKDTLPGDLKWKTWVDPQPESQNLFSQMVIEKINQIFARAIENEEWYHTTQTALVKKCLKTGEPPGRA